MECIYCKRDIPDSAKKCSHCHSYQDPSYAPRRNYDTADLVIKFVGSTFAVMAVAGAALAFFGIKSFNDIVTRAAEMQSQSEKQLTELTKDRQQIQAILLSTLHSRFG